MDMIKPNMNVHPYSYALYLKKYVKYAKSIIILQKNIIVLQKKLKEIKLDTEFFLEMKIMSIFHKFYMIHLMVNIKN